MEENFLNLMRSIYKKIYSNIIFTHATLKSPEIGNETRTLSLPLSFNIILEALASVIRQEKIDRPGRLIDQIEFMNKLLELISRLRKSTGTRPIHKNQLYF